MDLKKNNLYRLDFHPKRIKYRFLAQGFNLRFVSCSVSMQWMIGERKKKECRKNELTSLNNPSCNMKDEFYEKVYCVK